MCKSDNTNWSGVKFNKNAGIYLYGCNAGSAGNKSIAQIIANKTGVVTYAYTASTIFTNDPALAKFYRQIDPSKDYGKLPNSKQIWLVPEDGQKMTAFTPKITWLLNGEARN